MGSKHSNGIPLSLNDVPLARRYHPVAYVRGARPRIRHPSLDDTLEQSHEHVSKRREWIVIRRFTLARYEVAAQRASAEPSYLRRYSLDLVPVNRSSRWRAFGGQGDGDRVWPVITDSTTARCKRLLRRHDRRRSMLLRAGIAARGQIHDASVQTVRGSPKMLVLLVWPRRPKPRVRESRCDRRAVECAAAASGLSRLPTTTSIR